MDFQKAIYLACWAWLCPPNRQIKIYSRFFNSSYLFKLIDINIYYLVLYIYERAAGEYKRL